MAKRLNKNVVAVLTIAGMLLMTGAGVVLVMNLPKTDPQPIAQQAEQAAQAGEYEQSARLYSKAAARARTSGDMAGANHYMVVAGEMALRQGSAPQALTMWQNVILSDPQFLEAHERLVHFYLEYAELVGGKIWSELQAKAQALVDVSEQQQKKNYLAVHALGRALYEQRAVRQENGPEGIKRLEEARDGDKSEPRFADGLGNVYRLEAQVAADQGNEAEAARLLKAAGDVYETLIANPSADPKKVAKAHLNRGQFYMKLMQLQRAPEGRGGAQLLGRLARAGFADAEARAQADMEKAVSLDPTNVDVLVGMGTFWHTRKLLAAQEGKTEDVQEHRAKAREYYKRAVAADYDHYDGYLRLAQSFAEDEEHDAAIQTLEERIKRGIRRDHYLGWRNRQYMIVLRTMAFQMNLAKLNALGQAGQASGPAVEDIRRRLQELYNETIAELPGGASEPSALMMNARLSIVKNEIADAIKTLEELDKLMGGQNIEARRMLATLYARTNAPGLAEELLRSVLAVVPTDVPSLVTMAGVMAATNRPEEAIAMADRALAIDPTSADALRVKADAYRRQENWQALAEIQGKFTQGNADQEKLGQAALLLLQAQNASSPQPALVAQAEGLLKEVLKTNPLHPQALPQLVSLMAQKRERAGEIKQVLEQARTALDARRAQSTQPADTENVNRAQRMLDQLAISSDVEASPEDRLRRTEELIRRNPDPYALSIDLYRLYRQVPERADDAMKALQEAHRLKPEEPAVLDQLFSFALTRRDWKVAEDMLDKILKLKVDPSGGHFYRGQLLAARTDIPHNFADAVKEYRAGLAKYPSSAEGYALLGQALVSMNQLDEAARALEEARRRNTQLPAAAVGLAMIAGVQGRADDYQKYLAISSQLAPEHPWVQAELQKASDVADPKAGIARREQIRERNPKDVDNLQNLAELYRRDGRIEDARKAYQEVVALLPDDLRVLKSYADFLLTKQPSEPKAGRDLLKQRVLDTDAGQGVRKAAAQLMLGQHMLAEARFGVEGAPSLSEVDAAMTAAAEFSDSPLVRLDIGAYFAELNRQDQAEEWYRKAIAAARGPDSRDAEQRARRLVIQTMLGSRDFARSEDLQKELDAYRAAFPEDPLTKLFQAEFYSSLGRDAEAMEYYNDFVSADSDPALARLRRGLAYFRRSQWESAIADFRQVRQANPAYQEYQAWRFLALALENAGQNEAAIGELQALLEETRSASVAQQLYGVYKKLQRWDSAQSLVDSRSRAEPDNPFWDYLKHDLATSRNQFEAALPHALRGVEKSKQDPGMVDLLLKSYLNARRPDEAIKYIREKVPSDRQGCRVQLRLASALVLKKDLAGAIDAYLAALDASDVNHAVVVQALAEDAARGLDQKATVEMVRKRIEAHPQQRSARILLTQLQDKGEDYIPAVRELLAGATGTDTRSLAEKLFLLRELAVAHYTAKQFEDARKAYEQVLEIVPNDIFALNNLAYLLMDDLQKPEAALPYARRAVVLMPNNAGIIDTLGWNLVLLGNYEEGISRLREAIEREPQLAALHYHLAEAFFRRGSSPSARDKDADLREARAECTRAHQLIAEKGRDDEQVLAKVLELGKQLELTLDANVIKAGAPTASR